MNPLLLRLYGHPWALAPAYLNVIADERFTPPQSATGGAGRTTAGGSRSGNLAVVNVFGPIDQRSSWLTEYLGGVGADDLRATLNEHAANASTKAIVLNIDSPGGSVYGIQELADTINQIRASKPVIAIANSEMASAAFWIGSQASELYVTPGGQVGSIGVVALHMDYSAAYEQAGIKPTVITAGRFKWESHGMAPLNDSAAKAIQDSVNTYYESFVGAVARGRGVSTADVRNGFGQGRMVHAQEAVKLGMVDGIKTLDGLLSGLGASLFQKEQQRRAAAAERQATRAKLQRDIDEYNSEHNPKSTAYLRKRRDTLTGTTPSKN